MRRHDTSGTDCWCGPDVREVCPECAEAETSAGCWRCWGVGAIPCEDPARYDGPYALMVVHRESEGR